MPRSVWKYTLKYRTGPQLRPMPDGARIVHVGEQGHVLTFWAEVDPSMPLRNRWFEFVGTGWDFEHSGWHVGTTIIVAAGAPLVWHVYELTGTREDLR